MKFCVIGVGRFGYHVATTLAENGMDVLAVDSNESVIASIRDKVSQAICMRVADEDALRSIGIEEMDTVIVAMGENFAQSILVTALLKRKLNARRVITRSISDIHKEILTLIGADQVILPERAMGIQLADNLSLPFNTITRLSPDFSIAFMQAPKKFVGKTLNTLDLRATYHVNCIAKRDAQGITFMMSTDKINEQDELLFAGSNKDLEKIAKL